MYPSHTPRRAAGAIGLAVVASFAMMAPLPASAAPLPVPAEDSASGAGWGFGTFGASFEGEGFAFAARDGRTDFGAVAIGTPDGSFVGRATRVETRKCENDTLFMSGTGSFLSFGFGDEPDETFTANFVEDSSTRLGEQDKVDISISGGTAASGVVRPGGTISVRATAAGSCSRRVR